MNPFVVNSMAIDTPEDLFSREEEIKHIRQYVDSKVQTAIFGVEGVGKTSLLNSTFNQKYRIAKAKENILISSVTEYPSDLKNDEIYKHFIETIISSVRILSLCGKEEKEKEILEKCRSYRLDQTSMEGEFEVVVNTIHDYGYHIILVIDNFEKFTSSKDVTMKHHETLRRMLKKTQYIVASNYDFNEDSLPSGVSGSLLLMNFAGHEIRVGGWAKEQTLDYLNHCLANETIKFSETLSDIIFTVSGGIPMLVKSAAQFAYEYIEKNNAEKGIDFIDLYNEPKTQIVLEHWCKILTPFQIDALRKKKKDHIDTLADKAARRSLYLRGIFNYAQLKDSNGNIIVSNDKYQPCCYFLTLYSDDGERLERAAEKNPLRQEKKTASPPHAPISVDQLLEELYKRLEDGEANKEQLLSITKSLCRFMPNVTNTIDLNEDLQDDILSKYMLSREYMERFDPRVREFIFIGIQMDRCFANVMRTDFDFSPVYLSFCKAVELHVNLTLVPIMKKVSPNAVDQFGKPISSLPSNQTLMIGSIITILNKHQIGIENRVIDEIKYRCKLLNLRQYPDSWWDGVESLMEEFPTIRDIRNMCPHTSILNDESGTRLLNKLFGRSTNVQRSFMMKCLNVHRDFMNAIKASEN